MAMVGEARTRSVHRRCDGCGGIVTRYVVDRLANRGHYKPPPLEHDPSKYFQCAHCMAREFVDSGRTLVCG